MEIERKDFVISFPCPFVTGSGVWNDTDMGLSDCPSVLSLLSLSYNIYLMIIDVLNEEGGCYKNTCNPRLP